MGIIAFNQSCKGIISGICTCLIVLILVGRFIKVKTCCELSVAYLFKLIHPLFFKIIARGIIIICVKGFSVCGNDGCNIESAFHPSLDFEGIKAGFGKLGNIFNHAQITGIENISPSFIFFYRIILPRSLFLHKGIFPPAWMSAHSPVGIPFYHEI